MTAISLPVSEPSVGSRARWQLVAALLHQRAGELLLRAKRRTGLLGPLEVQTYRGYGNAEWLAVKGRVLERRGVTPPATDDSTWRNLGNMVRRFTAAPIPGASLRIDGAGTTTEVVSDAEGYFRSTLRTPAAPAAPGWRQLTVTLTSPASPKPPPGARTTRPPSEPARPTAAAGPTATAGIANVLIPSPTADFGVISDLDDTVIRSSLSNLLLAARILLGSNARTRSPFEGVAAFYRALAAGPSGSGTNPVFYVSSSPWNLYDLLEDFLTHHGIPVGPLRLRAWGLDADTLPTGGHLNHKLVAIRQIVAAYPGLKFVLIGDSGQQDPEIYSEIAAETPSRVSAVYIRDVTSPARDEVVHRLAAEAVNAGVEFRLVADSLEAARHAASQGLLRADALTGIAQERARDAGGNAGPRSRWADRVRTCWTSATGRYRSRWRAGRSRSTRRR